MKTENVSRAESAGDEKEEKQDRNGGDDTEFEEYQKDAAPNGSR